MRWSVVRTAFVGLAVLGAALAQEDSVWAPGPMAIEEVPITRYTSTNELDLIVSPAVPLLPPHQTDPLQWGRIRARPHLYYGFRYGNGIQSSPGNEQVTGRHTIAPGLLVRFGERWSVDYTPTLNVYSNRDFQNYVGHRLRLNGSGGSPSWRLGFSQGYSLTFDPLVQTGTQTERHYINTSVSATHPFGRTLSLNLGFSQSIRLASEYTDTIDWMSMNWLNCQVHPAVSVGVGTGFGYTLVEDSPDMTYQPLQGRVVGKLSRKVSASLSGGAQFRQFIDGRPGGVVPIWNLSLQYEPFDVTRLYVATSQGVNPSYFQAELDIRTSVSAGINQRLFKHFNLSVSGSYRTSLFGSTEFDTGADREDEFVRVTVRLGTMLRKRIGLGVLYEIGRNTSDLNGFSFDGSQTGVDVSYRY